MQYVKAPISTVAIGRAASFGTVILMAGDKGRRFALPNARIHMHQPLISGRGLQGQASDLDIHAREILRIKQVLNELIAKHTGQSIESIEATGRSALVEMGRVLSLMETTDDAAVPSLAATSEGTA